MRIWCVTQLMRKEKPEGSLESKVGKGRAAGPFILLAKVMAETTKVTKGSEKFLASLGLVAFAGMTKSCDVKMYLINWTSFNTSLAGLPCKGLVLNWPRLLGSLLQFKPYLQKLIQINLTKSLW